MFTCILKTVQLFKIVPFFSLKTKKMTPLNKLAKLEFVFIVI